MWSMFAFIPSMMPALDPMTVSNSCCRRFYFSSLRLEIPIDQTAMDLSVFASLKMLEVCFGPFL